MRVTLWKSASMIHICAINVILVTQDDFERTLKLLLINYKIVYAIRHDVK